MTVRALFVRWAEAAIPALEALDRLAEVAAVVTRPDRPRGRSREPQPSPVKLAALDLGLPVSQPHTKSDLREMIRSMGSFEVAVVVAFGMIIPTDVLEMAQHGFVNIHFSLLPRWRGAAPVQRAIAEGDAITGVTLMKMDEGLDTGGIISQAELEISDSDTTDSLTERLAELGAQMLIDDLPPYLKGERRVLQQSATGITYAAKVLPEEARLDLTRNHDGLLAAVRAFNPKPGAYVRHDTGRMKIWHAEPRELTSLAPGELEVVGGELLLGTAEKALALVEIQPAGKRRMAGDEWARGRQGDLGRFR